jgi:hypothetical protein
MGTVPSAFLAADGAVNDCRDVLWHEHEPLDVCPALCTAHDATLIFTISVELHSLLLTRKGGELSTTTISGTVKLSTTIYAIVASAQKLLALFRVGRQAEQWWEASGARSFSDLPSAAS